jgi:alcohol dehydrogenase
MIPFDYQQPTRFVFGPNRIDDLGDLAKELAATRALLCTDPGIVAAGHAQRAVKSLAQAGIAVEVFDGVRENPDTSDVERALVAAGAFAPDLLVGLGGGSSMDCAKGVNFLFSGGGRMQDYWGVGKATRPMLPMIAIPTTAGTGSEAQSFALISDADTHVKMACGDKKAACKIAILDPTLTVSQPKRVTALTGIDAIAHALETYVTRPRNAVSLAFSREAWSLLSENFEKVLATPEDLAARGEMQLGACFAGMAIENSMLGATHALANPLTAEYDIPHGQAIAIMLPHVVRFNGAQVARWYAELAIPGEEPLAAKTAAAHVEDLARFLEKIVRNAGLATSLAESGVDRGRIAQLAEEAGKQWTAKFNPRDVATADFSAMYQSAF